MKPPAGTPALQGREHVSDEITVTRVITPMPDTLLERVDDYRFSNRIPSRSEAIRRLLEIALNTKEPHHATP